MEALPPTATSHCARLVNSSLTTNTSAPAVSTSSRADSMPLHAETTAEDPRLRNLSSRFPPLAANVGNLMGTLLAIDYQHADRRIAASLILQQLLYYQIFFSISWLIFWIVWLFHTYWTGLTYRDDDVVRTVLMVLWSVFEPIRLAAGWYGNLQETLPFLILFCILTFAPAHVTCYYMMLGGFDIVAYNQAVQVVQAILLEVELIFGIHAVYRMYKLQKEQFYLFEFAMGQRRKALQTKREQLLHKPSSIR